MRISILLPVLLVFSSCACKKTDTCPNEVEIGPFDLSEEAKSFINYQGIKTLTFKDANANLKVFTLVEKSEGAYKVFDQGTVICRYGPDSVKINFKFNDYFYKFVASNGDYVYVSYSPLLLNFLQDYNYAEEPVLADYMIPQVNLKEEGKSIWLSPVIGRYPAPLPWKFKKQPLALLDKTYDNIYDFKEDDLFYNKEFGIVGYIDSHNTLWILDKRE